MAYQSAGESKSNYNPNHLNEFKAKMSQYIKSQLTKEQNSFTYKPTLFSNDSDNDIANLKIAYKVRQKQMIEGNIGQIVLGNAPGFKDLKTGHETKCDVLKNDDSMVIEVKNKYNTCNSDSQAKVCDKLSAHKRENPECECIWGIINPKKSFEGSIEIFTHNGVEIKKIQGLKLFSEVFTHNGYDYSTEAIKFVKTEISKY